MRATIIALVLSFLPIFAQAQPAPSDATIDDVIRMVRDITALERKAIVIDNLRLTASQSSAFWPVYDQYTADMRATKDRLVKLIGNYADNFGQMTDAQARTMLDDYLSIESDLLKVRKQYVKRFAKVVDSKTLARFYQIENKLEVIYSLPLVEEIPLVE
jgi:hypothetical protein